MVLKYVFSWALLIWLTAVPAANGQDVKTILDNVSKAIGVDNLKTLRYSCSGSEYQPPSKAKPGDPWTHYVVKSYVEELDLSVPAFRFEVIREEGTPPAGKTQNIVGSVSSPWEAQLQLWMTPYGFLKGARANNATVESQTVNNKIFNVVSFILQGKYKVSGYIDENNVIDKIETRAADPILGDVPVEASFLSYRDVNGIKFPSGFVQKRNGTVSKIIMMNEVKPNTAVNIPLTSTRAGAPRF